MNTALLWSTFRQNHWIRFAILGAYFLSGIFIFKLMGDINQAGRGILFVWILGTGLIGKDVSSGALHLILSRPMKRSEYVLSKWMALGLLSTAATWIYLTIGWIVIWRSQGAPSWQDTLSNWGAGVLVCFGASSALVFLSSLLPGLGDLALLFFILLVQGLFSWFANGHSWIVARWFFNQFDNFFFPAQNWVDQGLADISLYTWISYFSTVTIWLALTILILNRKEITYANS